MYFFFCVKLFYFILMLTYNVIILVPLEYGYVKLLQKRFLLELEFVNRQTSDLFLSHGIRRFCFSKSSPVKIPNIYDTFLSSGSC